MRSRYRANRIGNCGTAADACRDGCRRPALGSRGIGCRKAGELNAKLCIYLVRLHPNIAQRRASLWLDFLARAKVHAHADGGSLIPRRSFLKIVTGSRRIGRFEILTQVPSVPAAEAALEPRMARLHPEIEPLVRLI